MQHSLVPERIQSHILRAFIALAFATTLPACVTQNQVVSATGTDPRNYQTLFVQKHHPKYSPYSHYRLVDRQSGKLLAEFKSTIRVMEPGVNGPGDEEKVGENFNPEVRVSPSGNTLVITEDCWQAVPELDYLLVKLAPDTPPKARYVLFPSIYIPRRYYKGLEPPLYPHPADVLSVNDRSVTIGYRLSGNRTIGKRTYLISDLEKVPEQKYRGTF